MSTNLKTNLKPNFQSSSEVTQEYWLYILSNKKANGPLYLGDTTCLRSRLGEHQQGLRRDYAHYHRLDRLVYFEVWNNLEKFNARLRRVRNWPRDMRLLLIESLNPDWDDLVDQFADTDNLEQAKKIEKPREKAA